MSGRAYLFSPVFFYTAPGLMLQLNGCPAGNIVDHSTREKLPAQAGFAFKISPLLIISVYLLLSTSIWVLYKKNR